MTRMPESEDLNTPMIAVAGVIGAVIVFVMIVALQAWYHNAESGEMYRKVVAPAAEELASVTAEQQGQLGSYRMIDRQKGILAIPIDRAMTSVMQDLAAGKNPLPVQAGQPAMAGGSQPASAASRPEKASHER